jgi:hypothetical protein
MPYYEYAMRPPAKSGFCLGRWRTERVAGCVCCCGGKSGSRPGPEAIGSTWPPAACQRVSTARRAATFASAVSREASRVVAGAAAFGVSVRSEKSIIQSVDGPGCAMCPSRS